jgi:SAM-dependent methyltransferase
MRGEIIYSTEHVLEMLDTLLKEQSKFNWDQFYSDRGKPIPFFVNVPDENLVGYFESNRLPSGKVLELGCGPGRNAIYFAERGCTVDASDLSREAIEWGKERADEKGVTVNFIHKNIFDLDIEEASYDIVYDCGCFHYIPPHRRVSYLDLLNKALKPGGYFAITCFNLGGKFGGAEISDWDVYRVRSLKGGLGFTAEKLKAIFHNFEAVEIRKMREVEQPNDVFGSDALLTALFKKKN